MTDAYYLGSRRPQRFGWGWNRQELPIEAADHALRARLPERVLNHLNFGGYLMWALPQPVFIDGRLEVVGEKFFKEYREALATEPALEACVARYGIRWIIFPYAMSAELLGRLSKDARWRLAYKDHLAAIFVREGPGAAALVDPALLRELGSRAAAAAPPDVNRESPTGAAIALGSLPGLGGSERLTPMARWIGGLLFAQQFPVDDFNASLFYLFRGDLDPAQQRVSRAIARSGGAYYEMYSDLGAILYRKKELAEARRCYALVLQERPADRLARDRIAAIDRNPPSAAPRP